MDDRDASSSFPIGKTAEERGLSYVPGCYMVPPSHRLESTPATTNVSVVDLAGLHDAQERARVVKDIGTACERHGFFQVSLLHVTRR